MLVPWIESIIAAFLPSGILFPTRRLAIKKLGELPKLRGMICCPGKGLRSKAPYGVTLTLGLDKSVAKAGRSVNSESPFASIPVMMLNGTLDRHNTSGVQSIPPFVLIHAPQ